MKQNLIMDIVQSMLPYLNNAQTQRLQEVLQHTLFDYEVAKTERDKELSEQNLVEVFLSAKRIEGCSEKTLKYYKTTIQAMIDSIGKGIKYIVTDDIRCYLTEYQAKILKKWLMFWKCFRQFVWREDIVWMSLRQ